MTVHGSLRYDVFRRLLPSDVGSILEIGAGLGSVGSLLSHELSYVGLEPDSESAKTAAERIGAAGTVLNVTAEEFDSEQPFDAVCAFEVLEHMEDDRAALIQWQSHARPGGWLFLSTPKGTTLTATDVRQGHFRRYERESLERVLHDAGLHDVTIVAYGFPIGHVLHAASDMLARRRSHASELSDRTRASGRWMQPTASRAALTHAVAKPFTLVQRPFGRTNLGTGLVARARVPL